MQLGQLGMAGSFGLLGAVLIVNTASMPALAHIEFGPALFPGIVGWVMIGLSAFAAFDAIRAPAAGPEAGDEAEKVPLTFHNYLMFAAFVAAPVIYVAVAPMLGFLLTMPLIVGGLTFLASRRPVVSALFGIGLTILLHLIFYQMLRVTLPWGVLTPYAGLLTWR